MLQRISRAMPRAHRAPKRPTWALYGLLVASLVMGGCAATVGVGSTSRPNAGVAGGGPPHGASVTGLSERPFADSLQSLRLTDAPIPPVSSACAAVVAHGWTARENALPGTSAWDVTRTTEGPTRGYLDTFSTTCGNSVGLHLTGPKQRIAVKAYRIGWYGGAGARLVWSSRPLVVHPQKQAKPMGSTSTINEAWPTSLSIPITPAWVPGFYLLEPTGANGRPQSAIPLVVRDDEANDPILLNASVLTWTAYNDYGGRSLYHGPGSTHAAAEATRSRMDSMDRPIIGAGYIHLFRAYLPLVREAERLGIDVGFTTDIDINDRPRLLLNHAEVVFDGHDEYWTRDMYDGVEAARNHGVNLAFMGANSIYWQARLAPDSAGHPERELIVYRVASEDPQTATNPDNATVQWRQAPLDRDQAELMGNTYGTLNTVGGYRLAYDVPSWLTANSVLVGGSVMPKVVGNEVDEIRPGDPAEPPNVETLAQSLVVERKGEWGSATMSYYSAPSGAAVFAAGTTDWNCNLDMSCPEYTTPYESSLETQTITDNVLRDFTQPRFGATHPSHSEPPLATGALQALMPTFAWGYASSGGVVDPYDPD